MEMIISPQRREGRKENAKDLIIFYLCDPWRPWRLGGEKEIISNTKIALLRQNYE
jgi:hypothetical protein